MWNEQFKKYFESDRKKNHTCFIGMDYSLIVFIYYVDTTYLELELEARKHLSFKTVEMWKKISKIVIYISEVYKYTTDI